MQRFRIMGLYLVGIAVIIAASVWGVSLRKTGHADVIPATSAPILAVNQPSRSTSGESAPLPGTVSPEMSGAVKVSIDNFAFVPPQLTIAAGTTVTWVNNDDIPHTATSTAKPAVFKSKLLERDGTYSFQFTKPGTYEYFCKVHPHMTGRIVVK